MNLNKICIVPRARGAWEAVDLGFLLAKVWYRELFLLWCLPALLLFLILLIALPTEWLWASVIIVWWLAPLWDRGPLHYASLKFFGDNISVSATMRKLPSIYKIDIFPWLIWRRFNFTRSFDMPVTLLEHLKGSDRSQRLAVLHRNPSNASIWLTIALLHFQVFLSIAVIFFLFVMMPEYSPIHINEVFNSQHTYIDIGIYVLAFFSMAVVAPFYTLAGFALYINRRMALEGWDIEIRFRQLAENQRKLRAKASSKMSGATSASSLLICLFMFCSLWSFDSSAEKTQAEQTSNTQGTADTSEKITYVNNNEKAKQLIAKILTGEVFHSKETISGWRLKESEPNEVNGDPEWWINFHKSVEDFAKKFKNQFSTLAGIIEFFLWILVISFIIFMIYHYRQALANTLTSITSITQNRPPKNNQQAPEELFGLDLREQSLPEDIPSEVRQLWQQNDHRAALSLLYRACLYRLIHQWGFDFSEGDTEGDCAKLVKLQGDASLSDYTEQLTQCWQLVAYAHRNPENNAVETLCQRWSHLFETPIKQKNEATHSA